MLGFSDFGECRMLVDCDFECFCFGLDDFANLENSIFSACGGPWLTFWNYCRWIVTSDAFVLGWMILGKLQNSKMFSACGGPWLTLWNTCRNYSNPR